MRKFKAKLFADYAVLTLLALVVFQVVCSRTIPDHTTAHNGIDQSADAPESESIIEEKVVIRPTATAKPPKIPEPQIEVEVKMDAAEDLSENTNPYAGLELSGQEKQLLARMVYSEAKDEPFDGQVAVVQVALNRFLHPAFPGTLTEIVLAPNQFSVGRTFEARHMEAVEAALAGEPALDLNTDVVFFSTGALTYGSYYKTICCHVFRTYT